MTDDNPSIVVLGAQNEADLPGVEALADDIRLKFATTADELGGVLPGCEILLGWDFRADALHAAWHHAVGLKWIHWCGAGVDALLFPALRDSGVILTNARGVFDRAMAEYVLGLVIAMAKHFDRTFAAKSEQRWAYRLTEMIEGRRVLIVGVGGIGRCMGRLLRAVNLQVDGVGRAERQGDADFDHIHAIADLDRVLGQADFVINVTPLTEGTLNLFSARQFVAMKPSARFINVGRGASVDETALLLALQTGEIAGAALDVFQTEPLPADSPLWRLDNLIISPHMSGDYEGYQRTLFEMFVDNLRRYRTGAVLRNIVDKQAGFVHSGA